jgi:iron complex outermembrane receptor protein
MDPDESEEGETPGMEEIRVKGSRADALVYEQPLSVTHFDASQLKELRIQDISDLANYTPNLEINTAFAASNPTIFIRGIGLKDYNANAASAVAVYQDGVAVNSPAGQLFQLFDVQSIEVLRGPQGGVNGRNATAGAIVVNSFKPDGDWSASGDFSYGNYNRIEANGALGFPIFEDVLSARVAFTANFADGYVSNDCAGRSLASPSAGGPVPNVDLPCFDFAFPQPPIDPATGERRRIEDGVCDPTIKPGAGGCPFAPRVFDLQRDQNDTRNWATRGLLLFQPTDSQEWLLNFHWGQNRSDSFHLVSCGLDGLKEPLPDGGIREITDFDARKNCIGQNTAGWERPAASDAWTGYYDLDGKEDLDIFGASLTGNWDLGSMAFLGPSRLLAIGAYEDNEREVDDEGDGFPGNLFSGRWTDETWQVSGELRLEGEGDNYSWTGGAFFLREELTAFNEFNNATKTQFDQTFDQTLLYWAPYVGFRYDFINGDNARSWLYGLSLEGGARYNWEKKEFTLGTEILLQGGGGLDILPEETVEDTWTAMTGELTLIYKPIESFTTYAKYARGFKGGHFNAGATSELQIIDPVDPEFVDSAELGVKGRLFDDRLQFSVAAFRYWYQDMQVFDIVNEVDRPPTQQLLNSDADVRGVEVSFDARPFPGLYISIGAGWLDSEFVDFMVTKRVRQLAGGPDPGGDPQDKTFDYSGNPTIAAPEWNVSGTIEQEITLPRDWGVIVPQFSFSWRSEYFTDPSAAVFAFSEQAPFETYNDGVLSQPSYWLLNARLSYRWTERFEIAGWVENITNQEYLNDSFDLSQCCAMILQVYGRPRMYGMTISYNY